MSKVEVKVEFETITPLWTGDAWMENLGIRPSSLIGSLRFWFEVICYFGGICKKEEFDKDKGRFEKDIKNDEIKKKLLDFGTDFNSQVQALRSLNVPIPAILFGTTGWRSLVEIKGIQPLEDYYFGNKLNLPGKFCINKNNPNQIQEGNNCPQRSNNTYSVFYFKIPYFWGKFLVIFEVEQDIKNTIFLPLLTFMDKYGYWGGGWNIGYGRLRVVSVENQKNGWQKEEFDLFFGLEENKKFDINSIVGTIFNANDITDKTKKQILISKSNNCKNYSQNIKNLILEKAKRRKTENSQKDRHYLFGKTGNIQGEDLPQGSKILPYINKSNNGSYECGLLSIAGILSLYE